MGEKPKSFRSIVLQYILAHGECSIGRVVGGVGKHITATQATRAAMRRIKSTRKRKNKLCRGIGNRAGERKEYTHEELILLGKKIMVGETLCDLYKTGLIKRVGKGVYAPPDPKLFVPTEQSA